MKRNKKPKKSIFGLGTGWADCGWIAPVSHVLLSLQCLDLRSTSLQIDGETSKGQEKSVCQSVETPGYRFCLTAGSFHFNQVFLFWVCFLLYGISTCNKLLILTRHSYFIFFLYVSVCVCVCFLRISMEPPSNDSTGISVRFFFSMTEKKYQQGKWRQNPTKSEQHVKAQRMTPSVH